MPISLTLCRKLINQNNYDVRRPKSIFLEGNGRKDITHVSDSLSQRKFDNFVHITFRGYRLIYTGHLLFSRFLIGDPARIRQRRFRQHNYSRDDYPENFS